MIIAKSKSDLEKMRRVGELIAGVREALRGMVEPGITTLDLNNAAEKMIRDAGAYPTFLGYQGFPFSICASVNEAIVHGFPTDYELKEGDIFSMDMGATLDGFVGDTATTVPLGNIDPEVAELLKVTEKSLYFAIEQCVPGGNVGDIGWAVQTLAEEHGYGIVQGYTGHGIGRNMHEAPQIPNYGRRGTREKIRAGFVFAIEPMLNLGSPDTKTLADGWTVVTADGKPSAHFEHTVAVTEEGPEILTLSAEQKLKRGAEKGETVSA
ncbi:MAG: type I methionyl aminopeptidase [Acidobacteria bacterium]|nr:MAG: type I methionyl aminopeptidase [Acidobacteriota bacterium]REK03143.1 MAG: type I methionyl aminopeptidase [Acidobacteriota bacterium]REK13673.1 MAG: type I methionyl aminopeptidase [Acidobacteriota bacterium]REK41667.1 MAG: type I methionyl aminopeptidase [Acidobacteriota bacterium]